MKANNRNIITLFAVIIFTAILLSGTSKAETTIWAPEPLNSLIEEGLSNNQSIQSLKSQIDASTDLESVAGALPDPRVGIGLLNLPVDTFSFDQEPMTQKQVSIAQKFPWFGKLDLQTQRAALITEQKKTMLTAEQLALSKNIADAWYDLGFILKSQDINHRLTTMIERVLSSTESKYSTGYGLQQDIFQAQVELSKLADEKITLNKKRRVIEDRINELLNRKSFQAISEQIQLVFPDIKIRGDLSVTALQVATEANNPVLKAQKIEILKEQTNIDLAHKDYMPDFDIKFSYGQREESKKGQDWEDFFSAAIVMDIPLWKNSRQDKVLSASKSSHMAAEYAYRNLRESLRHKVDSLTTEIQNLQENYKLYTVNLLPQAEQWVRAAKDAYEVDRIEFDTMINAQIRLLKFELQAQKYLFDIYKKRTALEAVTGKSLDDIEGSDSSNSI